MANKHNMDYALFLRCLKECADRMDETWFLFLDDEARGECVLGYIPCIQINSRDKTRFENPYWIGTGCDIANGAGFQTAEAMLEAKAYGGRSIREAWENVRVLSLGSIPPAVWFDACPFREAVVENDGYWRLRQ